MIPFFIFEGYLGSFEIDGFEDVFKDDSNFATVAESAINFTEVSIDGFDLFADVLLEIDFFREEVFDYEGVVIDDAIDGTFFYFVFVEFDGVLLCDYQMDGAMEGYSTLFLIVFDVVFVADDGVRLGAP
jgi:hypothetical protein